jgi:hypothetical protein
MLQAIKATNQESGFYYTFMAYGKPKNKPKSEEDMENFAYCCNYVDINTKTVLPIANEILPFNEDDPRRMIDSEIATGFFIVDTLNFYHDTFSKSYLDFGIKVSKEGILNNEWVDSNIL